MTTIKAIRLLCCLIYTILLYQPAYAIQHNEKFAIKEDFDRITLSAEADYRFDNSSLFRQHYDIGTRIPITLLGDDGSIAFHYRSVYKNSDDEGWELEKRPYIQLQKIFKTDEFKLGLRTRQEYRIRNSGNHTARNRSRVKIQSKQKFFNTKPFISNEFFYDFDKNKYNKNRIDVGMNFSLDDDIKSSIYYKLILDKEENNWQPTSSIVFKLQF